MAELSAPAPSRPVTVAIHVGESVAEVRSVRPAPVVRTGEKAARAFVFRRAIPGSYADAVSGPRPVSLRRRQVPLERLGGRAALKVFAHEAWIALEPLCAHEPYARRRKARFAVRRLKAYP